MRSHPCLSVPDGSTRTGIRLHHHTPDTDTAPLSKASKATFGRRDLRTVDHRHTSTTLISSPSLPPYLSMTGSLPSRVPPSCCPLPSPVLSTSPSCVTRRLCRLPVATSTKRARAWFSTCAEHSTRQKGSHGAGRETDGRAHKEALLARDMLEMVLDPRTN